MRFRRMPFGILSAAEVVQKRNTQAFGDIQSVQVIVDDLIITAASVEEHDQIMRRLLNRARELKVKFNKSKIQFKVSEVLYMGNAVTAEGMRPDKAKVEAITNMPAPQDKPALHKLLGVVKYLAQYIPYESELTAQKVNGELS